MSDSLNMHGVAICVDICDSTNQFEALKNKIDALTVIEKLSNLIKYSIDGTKCKLVRYTGDGALLFYPDNIGFSAVRPAIELAIELINSWKKCCLWFPILKPFKIRVSLDLGDVVTNDDGGLWYGLPLNNVSKMKVTNGKFSDNNRVLISNDVYIKLNTNSIYFELFNNSRDSGFPSETNMYYLSFKEDELIIPCTNSEKISMVVCINGVGSNPKRLQCVLASIENQSVHPEIILIATSQRTYSNCTSALNTQLIDADNFTSQERAYVRNQLLKGTQSIDVEYVCFLDGDTLLFKDTLSMSRNFLLSSDNTVISVPRMDFDIPLNDEQVGYITNILMQNREKDYISNILFQYSSTKKTDITKTSSRTSLPSYTLFLKKKALGVFCEWDENFHGWGEEDIDYTHRMFIKGYVLLMPQIKGLGALHLTHNLMLSKTDFFDNAVYLLSKHPNLYSYRESFYHLLGI